MHCANIGSTYVARCSKRDVRTLPFPSLTLPLEGCRLSCPIDGSPLDHGGDARGSCEDAGARLLPRS